MKVTKSFLKHLIKEEIEKIKEEALDEGVGEFFTKARQKIFGKNKEEKTLEINDLIKKSKYYTDLQKIADKGALTKESSEKYIKAVQDKKWDNQGGFYLQEADEETKQLFREIFIEEIKKLAKVSSKKVVDQSVKNDIIEFITLPWGLFTPEGWLQDWKGPFDRAQNPEEKNKIVQELFKQAEEGAYDYFFQQRYGSKADVQLFRDLLKDNIHWLFRNKKR